MTTHVTEEPTFPAQNEGVSPDSPATQALITYQTPATPVLFDPGMSEDEKIDLLTAMQEYTGVAPVAFPIGSPRRIIGCFYNRINVPAHVDETTGEYTQAQHFEQALFKSDDLTDDDGNPRIYMTSSRLGLEFAQMLIAACGQGDWTRSRTIRCNQEERKGKDGQPRRMYRWQIVRGE